MTRSEPNSFRVFELDAALLRAVEDLGFRTPTPVQERVIPLAVDGRDVLGRAPTGTGKTAAFGLPMLQRLLPKAGRRARALVLAPTRELARQVHGHLEALARHTKLAGVCVVGGEDMAAQEDALRRGADWVVATPGRLAAHLRGEWLDFGALQTLVLDEADRLLEFGFLAEIQEIVASLPPRRQTMLFSATLPADMQALARQLLNDPARVEVGEFAPPERVMEEVWPVAARQKLELLRELVERRAMTGVLIFARTRKRADSLAERMSAGGLRAEVLHAERPMAERRRALASFAEGECDYLVATDLAARGLDVSGILWVVNYDVPAAPEDYVHRAGRTGRAGRAGTVLTLQAPVEELLIAKIEHYTGRRAAPKKLEGFEYIVERAEGSDPREQVRKPAAFSTRMAGRGSKKSPFTKSGKVRAEFEVPDTEKDKNKPRRKKAKMKRRLPHQR